MMSMEGPFLAAIIARLRHPRENLAAYGIAFAFALLIESPVIMLLSASTALVQDSGSFISLRRFTYILNALLTLVLVVVLLPPIFGFLSLNQLHLPEEVADLTHLALALLLPWPAAIGYRRFHQGLLVRNNMTRLVALGTVLRLSSMALTAIAAASFLPFSGAHVGALALSAGVVAEAIASGFMAHPVVQKLRHGGASIPAGRELPLREILDFYVPLALTTFLAMGVQPMVTFFMGQSRFPLESLAVLPVVYGLSFIFRSLGLSFQEVGIALMGDRGQHYLRLRNFALSLAVFASSGLALIAFTPLSTLWFHRLSGLSPELTRFALLPTRILTILPALTVLLAFQRALLMNSRTTSPLTGSTTIEISSITAILILCIYSFDMIGVVAAAIAMTLGRVAGNFYLLPPCWKAIKWLQRAEA